MSDQDLNDLLKEFDNPHHCYPPHLVHAIRLLVNQRDEARREAATFYARQFYKDDAVDRMSRIYAEESGWDCFKENA